MRAVLDAFAILAWMQEETGADLVEGLLRDAEEGRSVLFLSAVNAGEVYYRLAKSGKPADAAAFLRALRRREFPLTLVLATNRRVWAAAALKAQHAVSYADAFAAALALELGAPVVSGDPELLDLARGGVIEVNWPA